VLVNNAGIGLSGAFTDLNAQRLAELIRINVVCLTTLCRLFGADMVQRRSGRILNVASTAAFQAGPYMSAYYASKAYVLLLSEGLHAEMKPHGVGVTALCPGPTRTDFFERAGMVGSWLERSPFIMRAAQVAVIGAEGLMQGKPVVIPGLVNRMMAFTTRFAPRALLSAITARLNR
jgi:short-subunit dehydrogenase